MPLSLKSPRKFMPRWRTVIRGVIEVSFILFLFYANLLMGEFTASSGRGKTLAFALHDVLTGKNLLIAILSALVGYLGFEFLRRKLL